MRLFPIRHHSPAGALQLERLVRATRPRLVLVEGPVDADPLIDLLLDPDTRPPVALYAYRGGEPVQSLFYPFCDYSPEYVALRVGREVGATVGFCDLSAGSMLAARPLPPPTDEDADAPAELYADEPPPDHRRRLAQAAGFDDFESFWEAAFEQDAAAGPTERYLETFTLYGARLRGLEQPADLVENERRERHMAAVARQAVQRGIGAEEILLVCGAFHTEGIARFFAEESDPPEPPAADPAETVLIPFSFTRLSEQTGYGAGNRAPWYYQQVWEQRGDFAAATRLSLLGAMHHLRRSGGLASLAQAIDAETLAFQLAHLREKRQPGADELMDAAVSCFGQGEHGVVREALRAVLVGDRVGRLSPRAGRTPLQSAFYAATQSMGLPVRDAPRDLLVHLTQPREAAQSTLLHRLVVARIPYGRQLEVGLGGRGRDAEGGALAAVGRTLEKWQVQWTPDTDAQLIERSAWGSTFEEVCRRLLADRLAAATRVDQGAEVLLELALCDLGDAFGPGLDRCEQLAGDSASFAALARAAYALDGLLGVGTARRLPVERLRQLSQRLFARAVVHLPAAADCGDEGAAELRDRLAALHELVLRPSPTVGAEGAAYWRAVARVAEQPASHPACRGFALLLLEQEHRLGSGGLAGRLRFWLAAAVDPADSAKLVAALFSGHRNTLLRRRDLVGAVTEFLVGLELDQLAPLLPILRGSLGQLAPRERDVLAETLAAVLDLGDDSGALRDLALPESLRLRVRSADAAVAETLTRWEALYGIC